MDKTRWEVMACPSGHISERRPGLWSCWCGGSLGERFEVVRAVGARSSDPDTSKLAALKNEPRRGSQRARILAVIRFAGAGGLTAREAERESGVGEAHKRVSELRQGGHIIAFGRRTDPQTGAEGEVFISAEHHRPALMDVDEED